MRRVGGVGFWVPVVPLLLTTAAIAVGLVAGWSLVSNRVQDHAADQAAVARTAVGQDLAMLDRLLAGWAAMPETYDFVVTRDPEFARQQWAPERLAAVGADLLLVTQPGASVVFSFAAAGADPAVMSPLIEALRPLLTSIEERAAADGAQQGVVATDAGPVLVAVRPIEGGTQQGRLRGLLVAMRVADSSYVAQFSERTGIPIAFAPASADTAWPQPPPPGIDAAREELGSGSSYEAGDRFDESSGFVLLDTLPGGAAVLLRADASVGQAASALRVASLALIAAALVGATGTTLLVTACLRVSGRRIEEVRSLVAGVTTGDWSAGERLAGQGSDAIGRLADELAQLLNRLQVEMTELIEAGRRETAQQLFGEAILRSVAEGVILLREDGVCQVCNPAAAALLGIDQREALGSRSRVQEILGEDVVVKLREVAENPAAGESSMALRLHGRHLVLSSGLFSRPDSEYSGLMILIRDVSVEIEAERLRRDLVGIVSHELRTPLAVMTTGLSLLTELHPEPSSNEQEVLSLIEGNTSRMRELIDDLLDSTALDSGQVQLDLDPVDLAALCRDTLGLQRPQADEAGVPVYYLAPERPAFVEGDARRLRQVIANLLGNAIRYTPAGGQVWLQVTDEGTTVRLDVTNTGVPIAPDEQALVFERFFRGQNTRRNTRGTGLGLPISRAIIERHGGQLWLARSDDAATVFSCRLPSTGAPGSGPAEPRA